MQKRTMRTNISIFETTYQKLLKGKLKRQVNIGREITWDDFLLELVK
jgi:hypothetical protein